VQLTLSDLAYL